MPLPDDVLVDPGLVGEGTPTVSDRETPSVATDDELKRAFKAFKKRLKLTRLDDESGLSKGSKRSAIAGITPPSGFPPGIWEELVVQGKLRREGGGTYSLAQNL